MSASPKPSLVLIDGENGEIKAPCQRCPELDKQVRGLEEVNRELTDVITGLQRDISGWSIRFQNLKRDKAKAAKHHEHYGEVEIAFREWQRLCNHSRSPYTADRFWLALPYYENPKYGLKMMIRAVKGAAYDPFTVTRKNGSKKRFDEWERIFKDAGSFEDFCNRAPRTEADDVSSNPPGGTA
jgi:hypothetical protein